MARRKQAVQAGQAKLSGEIEGLDKLVNKPEVLEHDGLKVIRVIVSQSDYDVPKYVDTALEIARKMAPDIKSRERPPWLQQGWQVKQRKRRAGVK